MDTKSIFILIITLCFLYSCGQKKEPAESTSTEEDYQLVWYDDFDYEGLPDSTKWSYDTRGNDWGWGNNELQHYTAFRSENAWVSDGLLRITAIKEPWEGKEYTSARLITKEKGDWLYGKIVVRAKLPAGVGMWPAIWMLPTDWEYGNWPGSGEIDIMENVGYNSDTIYGTVHTKSYNHSIGTHKSGAIYMP
ncbi:MAG: family 16 glycosylhydrolase, partial [Cyclobacteriaceae bacterium]